MSAVDSSPQTAGGQAEAYPKGNDGNKVYATPAVSEIGYISSSLVLYMGDAEFEWEGEEFGL